MKTVTCCSDEFDPSALTVEQALAYFDQQLTPVVGKEQVAIRKALGRVAASTITAPASVPPFHASSMDGYAVKATDLPQTGQAQLNVVTTVFAGQPSDQVIQQGECARIFTGAPLPEGTDTVIMQEKVTRQDDVMTIEAEHRAQQFVTPKGADIAEGDTIIPQGKRLTAADIGLLASLGIFEIGVIRRVRVAFFSTGDELCSAGEQLKAGQIYDSNRYTLYSLLQQLDVNLTDMGVIPDQPLLIKDALLQAATDHDVVITSGGVSVGEADYVTEILQDIGTMNFWKIAMKPGRPLSFGYIGDSVFFGLPGNPVSVMATFQQFVQHALRIMIGVQTSRPLRFSVPCVDSLRKAAGRVEFQRGILHYNQQGELVVRSTGVQRSSTLRSMSDGNCFIILPLDCTYIEAGEQVLVEPWDMSITV